MLTLSKFSRGRSAYFLATTKGNSSGVDRLIEPDGVWMGDGLAGLATTAIVADHRSLEAMFDGRDPRDDSVLDQLHRRVKVAGFDCMISAPKSVSILHALCLSHRAAVIEGAHVRSVESAFKYLERESAYVSRTVAGRRVPVKINGFIGCAFVHRTSRSLDPHLHSHVLIANLGCDDQDRWSALDGRSLYLEMRTARALYDAQLRFELSSQLGVYWSRSSSGFGDVVGLPRCTIEVFSQRAAAISAELERNERGHSFSAVVAHRTRPEKQLDISYKSLVTGWRERAYRSGLSGAHLEEMFGDQRPLPVDGVSVEAGAIDRAVDSFQHSFSRSELLAAMARCSVQSTVAELEQSVDEAVSCGAVTLGSRRTTMRGSTRGATAMPLGRSTALYTTVNQRERRQQIANVVEQAAIVHVPAFDRSTQVRVHASVDAAGVTVMKIESEQPFAREQVVSLLAERCALSFREIVAVSRDSRKAAHFDAMTGVAAYTKDEIRFGPRAVVIVEGFDGPSLAELDVVFRQAEKFCCSVVAIESKCPVVSGRASMRREAIGVHSEITVMAGQVRVEFFRSPEEVVPCVELLARDVEASEHEVCIVAQDATLLKFLGEGAKRASSLERSFVCDPNRHFIVVGGARLFGSLLPDVADSRRTHVAVWRGAANRGIDERALQLAEPIFLRKALGRVPSHPADRKSWSIDAMTICREHRLRSLADRLTPSLTNQGDRLLMDCPDEELTVRQARETRFLSRNAG